MKGGGGRECSIAIDDRANGRALVLTEPVVAAIEQQLPTYGGAADHEGVVYLGGLETHESSIALVAISPVAASTWGSFRTDLTANADVVNALSELGLVLVGQVHSHPGDWVDHSDGDDDGALVRFEGYWSLVVPSFAREGMRPLSKCGIHLFTNRAFRRLSAAAVRARVNIVPTCVDLRR